MKYSLFLSLIVFCFFSVSAFGQDKPRIDPLNYFDENKRWYNDFTEHWFNFFNIPEGDVRTSIQHWVEIGDDLKQSIDPSIGGEYANGSDTHGDYLRWSEKRGFVWLKVNKCAGGPMKIIRGRVVRTPNSYRFIPEVVLEGLENTHHGHNGPSDSDVEFLPVKWRGVDYFIRKESLASFADYTAGLSPEAAALYDDNRYFSRMFQDYIGSVNDLPIYPIGYEKYVKSPVRAKILSVGKPYRRSQQIEKDEAGQEIENWYDDLVTEVKIDSGKSSGVRPGVLIQFLDDEDYQIDGVVVTKVYGRFSIAEYITDIPNRKCKRSEYEKCEAEKGRKLKAGMRLSTTGEW